MPCVSNAQSLKIVTEELPPLQITTDKGTYTGAIIEVVELLLKETSTNAKIEFYPWAHTYQIALSRPNTLIFSMLRDVSREEQFQWIGHLYTVTAYFAALNERNDIKINTLEDAKIYKVGTVRADLAQSYLIDKGFAPNKNLYVTSKYTKLWQLLYSGKIDVVLTNDFIWRYKIVNSELNPERTNLLYKIPNFSSELYLAASINTDKKIVDDFANALKQIKSDGRFLQIMKKWQLVQ